MRIARSGIALLIHQAFHGTAVIIIDQHTALFLVGAGDCHVIDGPLESELVSWCSFLEHRRRRIRHDSQPPILRCFGGGHFGNLHAESLEFLLVKGQQLLGGRVFGDLNEVSGAEIGFFSEVDWCFVLGQLAIVYIVDIFINLIVDLQNGDQPQIVIVIITENFLVKLGSTDWILIFILRHNHLL